MKIDEEKTREWTAQTKRLGFAIDDSALDLDKLHDIGASYVRAKQDRICVVLRPTKGAQLHPFSLNPDAAFELANAILEQGESAGWYESRAMGGHWANKTVQ